MMPVVIGPWSIMRPIVMKPFMSDEEGDDEKSRE
jgi:hypothetical protein